MIRLIDAFTQFFDDEGAPLLNGKLRFLVSGSTNTDKDTYSDSNGDVPNTNPVLLDPSGRCPNVFGEGAYRVISYDSDDVQIEVFDPVGDLSLDEQFQEWSAGAEYPQGWIVVGNDGEYYKSLEAGNKGNNPVLAPAFWKHIEFVEYYNAAVNYNTGNRLRDDAGVTYISKIDDNLGNTPAISPDQWKNESKIDWEDKTANFTAEVNSFYRVAVSAAEIEVTLPTGAVENDSVVIWDVDGGAEDYPIEVLNGAYTIMGASESFYIDKNYVTVTLTYDGTDWRFN